MSEDVPRYEDARFASRRNAGKAQSILESYFPRIIETKMPPKDLAFYGVRKILTFVGGPGLRLVKDAESLLNMYCGARTKQERLSTVCAVSEHIEDSRFTRFKYLPAEIRQLIWVYALPGRRIVRLDEDVRSCPRSLCNVRVQERGDYLAIGSTNCRACQEGNVHFHRGHQRQLEDYAFTSSQPRPAKLTPQQVDTYTEAHMQIFSHLVSPLLHTCHESRRAMTTHYELTFGSPNGPARVRFDPARDTLYLPSRRCGPFKALAEDKWWINDDMISWEERHFAHALSQIDKNKIKFLALGWDCNYSFEDTAGGIEEIALVLRDFPHLEEFQLVVQDLTEGDTCDINDIQSLGAISHNQAWSPQTDVKAVPNFVDEYIDRQGKPVKYAWDENAVDVRCQLEKKLRADLTEVFNQDTHEYCDDWVANPDYVAPDIRVTIFVPRRVREQWWHTCHVKKGMKIIKKSRWDSRRPLQPHLRRYGFVGDYV